MAGQLKYIVTLLILISICSCKKEEARIGCHCNDLPQEIVKNEPATVIYEGDFIIKRDTGLILYACSDYLQIPDNLKVDGIKILFSGEIMTICPNVKGGVTTRFSEITKL